MSIIIRVAVAIIIVYDHPLHVAMVNKSTHPHRGIASEVNVTTLPGNVYMRGPTDVVPHSRVSQQQRLEYEPIHHHSTQWLIHALNHIITQFGSTINVLINLKGPKVYVILVILIGASLIYTAVSIVRVSCANTEYIQTYIHNVYIYT